MRAVVQRVELASVEVEGHIIGKIGKGIMVLVGFLENDGVNEFNYMKDKLLNLRIFEDENEKMNLSLLNISGEMLIVPNFTLYGDCKKGRRPSFVLSSKADIARKQFNQFCDLMKLSYEGIQTGEFQANMKVNLVNDGPVTLIIDT